MKRILPFLLVPLTCLAADEKPHEFNGRIERLDPAFDKLVAPTTKIEKLSEGYHWSEGPTWYDGAVVFSDVPENTAYRWKEGDKAASVFLKPSGQMVPAPGFAEPGSNGLGRDAKGQLILCQHGERRVARYIPGDKPQFVTLADRYDGKRFNSPNDLAFRKNGDLYFTDPPYGLEGRNDSKLKELPFNGVYRLTKDGKVTLITKDLPWPNGIAFSPDEKTLYVTVTDSDKPNIMAFDVQSDGSVAKGRVFFDATEMHNQGIKGSCDGLKVDKEGNVWATVPGGLHVITPAGKILGSIICNEPTGNCCWGDDGSTLYITANMFLVRVKTLTKGSDW